jgi:hypothetical protein
MASVPVTSDGAHTPSILVAGAGQRYQQRSEGTVSGGNGGALGVMGFKVSCHPPCEVSRSSRDNQSEGA